MIGMSRMALRWHLLPATICRSIILPALSKNILLRGGGVGLFDIDHMGQFEITGDAAESFVSHMISARVSDLVAPMARYSLLLNEKGGIIDDLFVYRLQNSWWIVVNASIER